MSEEAKNKAIELIEFPIDTNGIKVKLGDKVKGYGCSLFCNGGFKIDRSPTVTVRECNGILYFGALSAKSFDKFTIVNPIIKSS